MDYADQIQAYYKFQKENIAAKEEVKKNQFLALLVELFPSANREVQKYLEGHERGVFVKNKPGKASIDVYYGNLIIEFERSLPKKLAEGKLQLQEYFSGLWNEAKRNYICIVSDGLNWHSYYPKTNEKKKSISPSEVELIEKEVFSLADKKESFEYFFSWINRNFFREGNLAPDITNFKKDFGIQSHLYEKVYENLHGVFSELKSGSEISLAFNQWKKYLNYTYGKLEGSDELFIRHTYLSVLSRFIIWAVLYSDEDTDISSISLIESLLNGTYFERHGITNLVEKDFFQWLEHKSTIEQTLKSWILVLNHLRSYDFSEIEEDFLKGIYQELVDPAKRHDLGEYYTPDWLCELIVDEVFKKFKRKKGNNKIIPKIIDPTCGSGSFLKASINKLIRERKKREKEVGVLWENTLSEILSNIIGTDIHPLAVSIAKANYVLALKDILKHRTKRIQIPVFLCDTLFLPENEEDQLSFATINKEIVIKFLKKDYSFPESFFSDSVLFDQSITFASQVAESVAKGNKESFEGFLNSIKRKFKPELARFQEEEIEKISKELHRLSSHFAEKIREKEDSIWSFIVRNTYRPVFFLDQFDIIVGNPPWLSYRYIADPEYQKEIKALAIDKYQVAPKEQKLMTHMELATIFLVHVTHNYLREGGLLGFVMPRSVFNADQHKNFRGESWRKEVLCDITEYWDLDKVSPLFNVPSCVVFSRNHPPVVNRSYSLKEISGRLPVRDAVLAKIKSMIKINPKRLHRCQLGQRTALSTKKINPSGKVSFYKKRFFQGATIVPRNLYFISNPGEQELCRDEFFAKTDRKQAKEGKKPWKDIFLEGTVETDFVFHTALSKNILPFFITNLPLVLLPLYKEEDSYSLMRASQLKKKGFRGISAWFKKAEREWEEKGKNKLTLYERLNYHNELLRQNGNSEYLVLYNAAGKNVSSVVLEMKKLSRYFWAEHKLYWLHTHSKKEAYYLSAVLNSEILNTIIKPFQSYGLLGQRDIEKLLLEIPIPEFKKSDKNHQEIVRLSILAHQENLKFFSDFDFSKTLAWQREAARSNVKDKLKKINGLVKKML